MDMTIQAWKARKVARAEEDARRLARHDEPDWLMRFVFGSLSGIGVFVLLLLLWKML